MLKAKSTPLPSWLKTRLPVGKGYERVKALSAEHRLHTVCEQARCPNAAECWQRGTAAFMILGGTCTRACRFCCVPAAAKPPSPDPDEPRRLAETIAALGLEYAVITTVCRDDLPDQGARHVAECIRAVKERNSKLLLEVLIQDFSADAELLKLVVRSEADVVAHNIETVERLTPKVRDRRAGYRKSLQVLRSIGRLRPSVKVKSSLMLGLGETREETLRTFDDLLKNGVQMLTLGQYLRPSNKKRHLPVVEFVTPEVFDDYGRLAREMGFLHAASGPFVRSSYRAGELFLQKLLRQTHDAAENKSENEAKP